jgi:hypothetical protein
MESDAGSIEEWKQLQARLVEKERELADIAVRHAHGEASEAQLDHQRRETELLRDIAKLAFDRMLLALRVED